MRPFSAMQFNFHTYIALTEQPQVLSLKKIAWSSSIDNAHRFSVISIKGICGITNQLYHKDK